MILCFLPFSIGSSVFGRAQWRQQSYPLPAALFARRVVVSPYWNETNDQFQKAPKELSLSPCGLKTKRDSPFFDSSGQFELRNDLLPHSLTFEVKWHHHQSPFWKSSNLFGLVVSHTAITDAFQMRREPPSWNATKKNWLVLDEFFFTPAVPFVVSFSRAFAAFSSVVFWVETLCVKGSWLNVRARAVTGGGLFLFFGFIFVVFFFVRLSNQLNSRISHSPLIHLLIMIHSHCSLYQNGESAQRGDVAPAACQWPVSFPRRQKRFLWMNTKGRGTRLANGNSRKSPCFFSNVYNFAAEPMKWWRTCCLCSVTFLARFVCHFSSIPENVRILFFSNFPNDGKRKERTENRHQFPSIPLVNLIFWVFFVSP